jgi:hypothetical protein
MAFNKPQVTFSKSESCLVISIVDSKYAVNSDELFYLAR